jgi:glutamate-1-semialdehyde 2,1-aminomutase
MKAKSLSKLNGAAQPIACRVSRAGARRAARLAQEAARYLVGGVNSPVRTFRAVGGVPTIVTRSRGPWITDMHGQRSVDFIMGWGALILGHRHPKISQALRMQLANGIHFGLTHEAEIELARLISQALPSMEQVRFMPSGTEAAMTAIRLARACTGRTKVLSFEGCYHGHSDGLLVKRGSGLATLGLAKSAGVPESIAAETVVVAYNDRAALEEAMARFGEQLACAIVEPIPANMGVMLPDLEWLRRLRALTSEQGALLIFDEVVTGFRVAYGGAQTVLRIMPDLTLLGKIIGGGVPIGALGGSRRLMQRLAPEGDVYHAGTFAGHPLAMAGGVATLTELARTPVYERLEASAVYVAQGLTEAAAQAGVPVQLNRVGSMLTLFFHSAAVRCFEDARRADAARFSAWANGLRDRGVLVPPSPFEAWFISTTHTRSVLQHVLAQAAAVFRAL